MLDSGTPQAWVASHGLTHPVLEVETSVATKYWSNFVGYPSLVTLKAGMEVVKQGAGYWLTDGDIQAILP